MENIRAFYLLDKIEPLTEKDRAFIKKHIEIYADLVNTLIMENRTLQDTIDYGRFIDSQFMAAKEELVKLWKDAPNNIECEQKLQEILSILGIYDEKKSENNT